MSRKFRVISFVVLAAAGLASCGEEEVVNSVDVEIVEREDFTYSVGYSNGYRFKMQVINNTDQQLEELNIFVVEDGEFLFSVVGELPPKGATMRTHDIQKNRQCKDISQALELKKNTCTLGAIPQDERFSFLQLVPPDA